MGDHELNCRGVYLIHFARPLHHARHYLGYARNIGARVREHRSGGGARLLAVIAQAEIAWDVVRIWRGAGRTDERRMKMQKNTPRLCPICRDRERARSGKGAKDV